MAVRMGWMDTPQTPERQAAAVVWGGLLESQKDGKGCDRVEGGSLEGRGVSHWVLHSLPMPVAVLQAEKLEGDPSWRKETERPPGCQWTGWTAGVRST